MPSMPFRSSRRLLSRGAVAGRLVAACLFMTASASGTRAETTAFRAAASTSPVVDSLVDNNTLVLHVRKAADHPRRHQARARTHHFVRHHALPPIERPALAGVQLLQPLPRPDEPPHLVVPLPAYGLDAIATLVTTPPPPVVCHPARRDPKLPDPHLYRERTVVCEADNP